MLGEGSGPALTGWRFFAHAPPSGVGKHLGSALAGLLVADFERLMECAERLALAEAVTGDEGTPIVKWRIHPALAEITHREEEKGIALAKMTAWFVERMSTPSGGWADVQREMEPLAWWLGIVPEEDWPTVVRAGRSFAATWGPFPAWMDFCERALVRTLDEERRSALLWLLADVAQHGGDTERASVAAEEMRELAVRTGVDHDRAVAWNILAEVHATRGQTREAARIMQEEVLPVLKQEGRTDEVMVVLSQLCDLLERDDHLDRALRMREQLSEHFAATGQTRERAIALLGMARIAKQQRRFDEALRITEKAAELLKGLEDNHTQATVWVEHADILSMQGHASRALEIYREKALPGLSASGDRAFVLSRMASVLQDMKQWDEALRIRKQDVMPVFRKLGDARAIANEQLHVGDILRAKGEIADAMYAYSDALQSFDVLKEARGIANAVASMAGVFGLSGEEPDVTMDLLQQVVAIHERRGDVYARAAALVRLAEFFETREERDKALRLYQEEVEPIFRNADDQKNLAGVLGKIANLLIATGEIERGLQILREQVRPFFEQIQNEHQLAWVNAAIADALHCLGDTTESLRIYETDVRPTIERVGGVGEIGAMLSKIGALLAVQGQYDRALDILLRSVSFIEQAKDARQQMIIRERLGRTLRCRNRAGDDEEAVRYLSLALGDAKRTQSPREPAIQRHLRNPALESITIRNFKNIEDITVDFARSTELSGQWTAIVGINGAGKSAILQAIALVLLGDERAADVGSTWLERMRRRAGSKVYDAEIRATVRLGGEQYELGLQLGERGVYRDHLDQDAAYSKMRDIWREREKDHLLLSYGPGRNLSEHLDARHDGKAEEVRRQMTLFDPLTQVAGAEALLEAREETKVIWLLLHRLLARVLEGTTVTLDADRSSPRFRIGSVTMSAVDLPDGFRATIALLADICATWHKKAPDEARGGDPSRIRGIVLVDEIDLHLHPSLQRVIIPRLRGALPEVQWIVTTHSPLIIGSFDRQEIVALEAHPEHGVSLREPLDRQVLGFTADEIYRWLMDVKPHSAAMETHFGNGPEAHARKALLFAQSPTVSEEEARANREYRRTLAERRRDKASHEKDKPTQSD